MILFFPFLEGSSTGGLILKTVQISENYTGAAQNAIHFGEERLRSKAWELPGWVFRPVFIREEKSWKRPGPIQKIKIFL